VYCQRSGVPAERNVGRAEGERLRPSDDVVRDLDRIGFITPAGVDDAVIGQDIGMNRARRVIECVQIVFAVQFAAAVAFERNGIGPRRTSGDQHEDRAERG